MRSSELAQSTSSSSSWTGEVNSSQTWQASLCQLTTPSWRSKPPVQQTTRDYSRTGSSTEPWLSSSTGQTRSFIGSHSTGSSRWCLDCGWSCRNSTALHWSMQKYWDLLPSTLRNLRECQVKRNRTLCRVLPFGFDRFRENTIGSSWGWLEEEQLDWTGG